MREPVLDVVVALGLYDVEVMGHRLAVRLVVVDHVNRAVLVDAPEPDGGGVRVPQIPRSVDTIRRRSIVRNRPASFQSLNQIAVDASNVGGSPVTAVLLPDERFWPASGPLSG